jgi:5-dehydro-2-deoxygluconokinase
MDIGYDRPLYILPFDHRASFEKGLFGFSAPLTAEQTARVAASKQVVYDGLKLALTKGVPCEAAASWSTSRSVPRSCATRARTA